MYLFKKLVVWGGKLMPFVFCFIILIGMIETAYSYINNLYIEISKENFILHKPLSWEFGKIIRYDWWTVLLMLSLSYGLNNCWKNKLAIYYLIFNLIQKKIIENGWMPETLIYEYLSINIIFLLVIMFLGIKQGFVNCKK